jgi:hypothetical protein
MGLALRVPLLFVARARLSYASGKSLPTHPDARRRRAGHGQRGGTRHTGVARMLPDLRFLIGAVLASTLLGLTVFSLATAIHLSHRSKLGPVETSRLLAYTPDGGYRIVDVPARRFDNPFANIPVDPNPVPLQQPPRQSADPADAPATQTAAAAAQPSASPEPPAADPDTVDERPMIDPPLPHDDDAPATAAGAAPAAETAGVAPSPEPDPPLAVVPVETAPAAPAPAPVVEALPTPSEVEQVGTIPATAGTADTRSEPPAVPDLAGDAEAPQPKAKSKREARKPATRARPRRAPPPEATQFEPFPFTGYPVTTTTSTADRPAKGFWHVE